MWEKQKRDEKKKKKDKKEKKTIYNKEVLLTIMLKILQHPILVNPTRWLRSNKKHASDLYQRGYYPSLQNNPFASALTRLEANSPTTTIPHGDGISLVVSKQNLNLGKQHLTLNPRIGEEIHEPSRLIINSSKYIKTMINNPKATQKLIPMQFIIKGKLMKSHITLQENILETIEEIYKQKIETLIAHIAQEDSGENGIVLTNLDIPIQIQGGIAYISNRGVFQGRELYIDYDKHPELSRLIIMYTDFKYL